MYMDRSLVELESIVRNRICEVCTERTSGGDCALEKTHSCALFRLFPQVARAIESVKSDEIGPYLDAIRRDVCAVCAEEAEGRCEQREQVRCALEAYLVPIVEAIEEATGKEFDRKGLGPLGAWDVRPRIEIRL